MFVRKLNHKSGKEISQARYSLYREKAVIEARLKTLEERIYSLEEEYPYDLYGIDDEVFDENLAAFDPEDDGDEPEAA